jgi:hypothetical protein
MTERIDHELLDAYERTAGEPGLLPAGHDLSIELWELLEALLLDLHLVRHDYADEQYARHVERELERHCSDASVVERIKSMRT